jgi:hypothetical protein
VVAVVGPGAADGRRGDPPEPEPDPAHAPVTTAAPAASNARREIAIVAASDLAAAWARGQRTERPVYVR